jgi:general secretion pathway protein E
LIGQGLLTPEGTERILQAATTSGTSFCAAATRLGLVSERDLAGVFGRLLGIEVVVRTAFPRPTLVPEGLNPLFLKARRILPLADRDDTLHLAMANPMDELAVAGVTYATGKVVRRYAALESDIEDYFGALDSEGGNGSVVEPDTVTGASDSGEDMDRMSDHASEAPVIRLVHRLLAGAMDVGASDVHFEPSANALTVRYRIDGLLQETETLSSRWSEAVASRIKLMARLDIAEKRIPQDGRIRFAARGQSLDLRVATFPTLQGEAIVLRLLGQQAVSLRLESLGLGERSLADLKDALARPHGIILITGPTGSGKTTTLYAALNAILRPELKIVTVEDPVEYTLGGVSQLQVKPEIGLSYASALRSVLRNDPDVIMIGEIRDRETADIAVRAALTGHLVLATLHTNTAAGAVTRLLDLGVEGYLLSSTLVFSAAQRLVRRLCPACRGTKTTSEDEARLITSILGTDTVPRALPVAVGCPKCNGRGYAGRLPLFEALPIHTEERVLIRDFRDEETLADCALRKGGWSLWRHGLDKVLAGETTLDEMRSVVEERS